MDANDPTARRSIGLWFGLVAAPTAWFGHLTISYAIAAYACQPGRDWLFHATTVTMLLLVTAGVQAAWRAWPRDGAPPGSEAGRRCGRRRFMAFSGIALGLSFFLVIVVQAIPNFMFDPCG